MTLKAENARQLLKYEPETGRFFWRERPRAMFPSDWSWRVWNKCHAGAEAFASINNHGYRHASILGRKYKAHRVAWLIQTGAWPVANIDHVNGVRADNRWENLRDVSRSINMRNVARSTRNTSGVTGVSWCKRRQKWRVHIVIDGRHKFLGYYVSIEAAAATRAKANAAHGFTARHGSQSECAHSSLKLPASPLLCAQRNENYSTVPL